MAKRQNEHKATLELKQLLEELIDPLSSVFPNYFGKPALYKAGGHVPC